MNGLSPQDLVANDLRELIPLLPDLGRVNVQNLAEIRAIVAGSPPELGDRDGIEVSIVDIPRGPDGSVPALLYRPAGLTGPAPALLNIHGGGFVAGTAQREDATSHEIATRTGCIVISPDYRLAPEHPYPAAIEDCRAALHWLAARDEVDPRRIAVRGVSAGGGLALGLALWERDAQTVRLAHVHLLYPMLDDRTVAHPFNGHVVWTPSANRFGWSSLIGDAEGPPVYAVPGRAQDFSGLPSVFLAVGSIDLFADEALSLASRLMSAGVPTELHLYPGAYHGFNLVTDSRSAKALSRDMFDDLHHAFDLDS